MVSSHLPRGPRRVPLHPKRKSESILAFFHGLWSQKLLFPLCSFIFLLLPQDSPFSHDTYPGQEKCPRGLCFQGSIKALSFYLALNSTLHR